MKQRAQVFGRGALPADFHGAALLLDKPAGWTSFAVVRRLRHLLPVRRIGHAGTLDPAATGLLICLVGRPATRQMETFMHMPKTYEGVMRLGAVTPSHDGDTPVTEHREWRHLRIEDLERVRSQFVGTIRQQPPMYSAVRVGGERLYRKARRGEVVERKYHTVTVYEFTLAGWDGADVAFTVRCSKGTYIRALARDMGRALGVGAHLAALRRTAIGKYRVRDAWTMKGLEDALKTQASS